MRHELGQPGGGFVVCSADQYLEQDPRNRYSNEWGIRRNGRKLKVLVLQRFGKPKMRVYSLSGRENDRAVNCLFCHCHTVAQQPAYSPIILSSTLTYTRTFGLSSGSGKTASLQSYYFSFHFKCILVFGSRFFGCPILTCLRASS